MSLHVYFTIVTQFGMASNNRGTNSGCQSTLQKVIWSDRQSHTTVSAEAIRFQSRLRCAEAGEEMNRNYDTSLRVNTWADPKFTAGADSRFFDDDVFGYMSAEAAKQEGEKGEARVRASVLTIERAISLRRWAGDTVFNAASPGATPSAQRKGEHPVPYGAEVHATEYEYGGSITPERLRAPERAITALRALFSLGPVAGNHARSLYDFSAHSAVIRITSDPAPRILRTFEWCEDHVGVPSLLRKVRVGDIPGRELIIGGPIVDRFCDTDRSILKEAALHEGVMAVCEDACQRLVKLVRAKK